MCQGLRRLLHKAPPVPNHWARSDGLRRRRITTALQQAVARDRGAFFVAKTSKRATRAGQSERRDSGRRDAAAESSRKHRIRSGGRKFLTTEGIMARAEKSEGRPDGQGSVCYLVNK